MGEMLNITLKRVDFSKKRLKKANNLSYIII
ncbi:hypothetical protein FBBAL38_10532 [Flavobacteria bacterium BAL38]|nr:hypothetical protein FBBAL38_10532 [Flavobacteria bacterium BAL38]